jgi:hypothetical protein
MNHGEDMRSEDKPVAMNAVLAEFNALRAEILFRATSQATLIQINVTAAGTIAVFALANANFRLAMIVIPILSPVLGILWLDHDATIKKLGDFIEREIKPAYQRVIKDFTFPDYQRYTHVVDTLPIPRLSIVNFNIAVFVTFGLLPTGALIYVVFAIDDYQSFGFLFPVAVAIIILVTFFVQFTRRFGPKSTDATGATSDLP